MRYRFIEDNRSAFGVERMCRILRVSRSGYYGWQDRGPSQRALRHERLLPVIRGVFEGSRRTYGSPRVCDSLKTLGHRCGHNQVAALMRRAGITPKRRRKFKVTTDSDHSYPVAPNLVARVFAAERLNSLWTSDITYLWTSEGWLYLAVVLDVCSRRIVGWGMSHRLKEELVVRAIEQALWQRQIAEGLIFHSDQGSQFASDACQKLLKANGIRPSMSRKGDCYDNAITESFFGTLKKELVYRDKFETREEARSKIFDFIEVFYNRQRKHSALNYKSPVDFEKNKMLS
jgi:transposase InsO family protein